MQAIILKGIQGRIYIIIFMVLTKNYGDKEEKSEAVAKEVKEGL